MRPGFTKGHPRNTKYSDEVIPLTYLPSKQEKSQPSVADNDDVDTSTPEFLTARSDQIHLNRITKNGLNSTNFVGLSTEGIY